MPAPVVTSLRVPVFAHRPTPAANDTGEGSADDPAGEGEDLVTFAYVQITSFEGRFYWIHVSESPEIGLARPPPSKFGACCVAIPSHGASVAATQLLDLSAPSPMQAERGEASSNTQAAAFSRSLAERLVARVKRDCGRIVSVSASCALEGERAVLLLGTEGGTTFPPAMAFASAVFRETLEAVKQLIL